MLVYFYPAFSSFFLFPFRVQAFSKKCIDRRKEWLTQWLQHRREKRDQGHNESLLYAEQMDHISYSDFINKELILFSNMDNERSIACSVDGEGYEISLCVCACAWSNLCMYVYVHACAFRSETWSEESVVHVFQEE